MVKLVLYEWRKHFLKKSIAVAIILFSVLNISKIYGVYEQNSLIAKSKEPVWNDLYWEMYKEFGGTIRNEKIDKLMSIYGPLNKQTADKTASTTWDNPDTYTGNVYNDTYFFRWNFVNPMEYAYMYENYAADVVIAAKENILFFESLGNQYEYKKNTSIAEIYQGRAILDFSYTEMYKNLIHYDFSSFLVILICMYALISVFVFEKESEMDVLLLTMRAGGHRTIAAKLLSSIIFILIVCSWFWMIDLVAFIVIFGSTEGTFSPVYAIENFSNASISMNLGAFVILSNFVKTIGIMVFGLFFLLMSTFFKNALFPFVISLVSTFGVIFIQEMYMGSNQVNPKVLNPFSLIVNRELFLKTEFMNFLGHPLISYVPALFFTMTWGMVCIFCIGVFTRKNTVTGKVVK